MTSLSGPEISGPHKDVGEMLRSESGPETPGPARLLRPQTAAEPNHDSLVSNTQRHIRGGQRAKTRHQSRCDVLISSGRRTFGPRFSPQGCVSRPLVWNRGLA